MTSMREKIARAIADEVGRRKNVSVEQLADAALNALSEPTEGMARASGDGISTSERIFVAMIQAAKDGA